MQVAFFISCILILLIIIIVQNRKFAKRIEGIKKERDDMLSKSGDWVKRLMLKYETLMVKLDNVKTREKLKNLKDEISREKMTIKLIDDIIRDIELLEDFDISIKESSVNLKTADNERPGSSLFYKTLFKNLLSSIIRNIQSTTGPISEELCLIRENIAGFIKDSAEYEEEVNKRSTMKFLMEKDGQLCDDIVVISDYINNMYKVFGDNIEKLHSIIDLIYEKSAKINDISEKISILSINSAIEAAKAGNTGTGFKVIAGEIRKLSNYSAQFVKEINGTIDESRVLVNSLSENFTSKEKEIVNMIDIQRDSLMQFSEKLEKFFIQFDNMYRGIILFTDKISRSVFKINPVVQLHEITVQEMENTELVIGDYFDNYSGISSAKGVGFTEAEEYTGIVRGRLTTSRELDSLKDSLKEFGLSEKINLNSKVQDIEFF